MVAVAVAVAWPLSCSSADDPRGHHKNEPIRRGRFAEDGGPKKWKVVLMRTDSSPDGV
jgi:hypothetical protein